MKEEPINSERVIILLHDEHGWIAAKTKTKMKIADDYSRFIGYDITPSLWYQTFVPNEIVEEIINRIPTDEQFDSDPFYKSTLPHSINLFW